MSNTARATTIVFCLRSLLFFFLIVGAFPAVSHERRDYRHVGRDVDDVRADGPSRGLSRYRQPVRDDLHGAREAGVAAGPRLVDPSVSVGFGYNEPFCFAIYRQTKMSGDSTFIPLTDRSQLLCLDMCHAMPCHALI